MPLIHEMYGPCDPRWETWFDVPEVIFQAYVRMYTRIRRRRLRDLINVMLFASGHQLKDDAREEFLDSIQDDEAIGRGLRPGPPPSRAFLQEYGIRMSRG